mgnify:CR=1 FL=1
MASFTRDDRDSGKWMVRWRETDENGDHNKKKRGFTTKKEAQGWFLLYQQEAEQEKM